MKVFSVAGLHHTGKTTTVVNLIKVLRKRGYKVVSIKDIHSEKFTMETEGSNSWKHWNASNEVVIARGLTETYQIWHERLTLNQMLSHLSADYVVVEGMKSSPLPRIMCAKDESQLEELVNPTVFAISGIYADDHEHYGNLPVISSRNEAERLADLVEEKVFKVLPDADPECCTHCGGTCFEMVGKILNGTALRSDCHTDNNLKIQLKVDGKEIKIVPFVQDAYRESIKALIRNLKGCEKGRIEIIIDE